MIALIKRAWLSRDLALLSVIGLTFIASFVRLLAVNHSPPGFYIDEAAISAQVICLRQSGASLAGEVWPLFTPVLGGGYLTPSYLAPAVLWTSLFGDSIASFRTLPAFFSILFIFGSFVFGSRFWKDEKAGLFCALSAAISPWAFQFARIAWDPSLAPAYLVWAFAFLWSSSRYKTLEEFLSGVCLALAAYCYPPVRLQIAIIAPLTFAYLYWRDRDRWKSLVLTAVTFTVLVFPLLLKTADGEIQGRFQMLSVFNSGYLQERFGSDSLLYGFRALLENLVLLLSPTYLFFSGDSNLRHSTGQVGIWSWLDIACLGGAMIGAVCLRRQRVSFGLVALCVVGYFAGLLPAAMTWESNPHALRSFGAIVFLSLGVGGAASFLWNRWSPSRVLIIGVAVISFGSFLYDYSTAYPARARMWFDSDVVEAGLTDPNLLRGFEYDPMAKAYYELASGARRCER